MRFAIIIITTCLMVTNSLAKGSGDKPTSVEVINPSVNAEYISVTQDLRVADEGSFFSIDVFEVPADKILIVDYVSVFADVVIGGRPTTTPLFIRSSLQGLTPNEIDPGESALVRFDLGFMEEYPMTSRGTPNLLTAREVKVYYGAGPVQCTVDTRFGGTNLDFGIAECSLSGRLIDAN